MKLMIRVLLVSLVTVPSAVHAEEAQERYYRVPRDRVIPGITAGALVEGQQIGQVLPEVIDLGPELKGKKELGEQLPVLIETEKGIAKQIAHESIVRRESVRVSAPSSSPVETGPGSDEPAGEPATLDLGAFKRCAQAKLPDLKKRFLVELRPNESVRVALDARSLNPFRGNGNGVSYTGILCGKFLGRAGMQKPSLREEIKLLSSASRREGEELKTLLRAYVAGYHPKSPVKHHALWVSLWRELSVLAVFSDDGLPALEAARERLESDRTTEVTASLPSARTTNATLTLTQQASADLASFEAGLRFATEMIP